jgi:ribonucleotide monophosphatase NagD (HAD superfamily)
VKELVTKFRPNGEVALLIDLDGVIYQGDRVIAGAADAIDWINAQEIRHRYITNTTSRSRDSLVDKLEQFGIKVRLEDIFTPIIAALQWLSTREKNNVALFVPEDALPDFNNVGQPGSMAEAGVDAVVIGDLGEAWDYSLLNRAFLVIGKPSIDFFELALNSFAQKPETAIMIGDDIVSDIQGAQNAAINTILVKTGKYREQDLTTDIRPDVILDSIAELPDWWQSMLA